MLLSLSIRDIVIIDRLELAFHGGLGVLTGETGAGKSILLDALGLALGARAEARLVRHGATQAVVSAEFDVADDHPARRLLADRGLDVDGSLVLRRVLAADGRSRAFVNDQPVSVGLLCELGEMLVQIQGQLESRGLLHPGTHRGILDAYGGLEDAVREVRAAHDAWRRVAEAEAKAKAAAQEARRDEDYLRHALAEFDALKPEPGEEAKLAQDRAFLMHGAKLAEAVHGAHRELAEGRGVEAALNAAGRLLERQAQMAGGRLDGICEALDSAAVEVTEAVSGLQRVMAELNLEPGRLEEVEERLFALRAMARKHATDVDSLAALSGEIANRLSTIEDSGEALARLAEKTAAARKSYSAAAEKLSRARKQAAPALERAVASELKPLKLKKAVFRTRIEAGGEADWGPEGMERVSFEFATIPGAPPGPLARIASGGELARFTLALKVVLAGVGSVPTLVFDEVDSGISGAGAAAVGERLARLGSNLQVLVVTHSPQVAARGTHHWRVLKREDGARPTTLIDELSGTDRREEIARMLAGAKVTDEARAAADRLLAGHP
ncbi:MAG: DNA repair protein RecN [Alphaproteobacteria bacterium]